MASWTTPKTWSTGETITKADLNTYVRDNTDFLHDPPRVGVTHSTVQSIPDATWTSLNFDTETYDTDSMHSNVTNNTRITINTSGSYVVMGQAGHAATTNKAAFALRIRRNGANTMGQQGPFDGPEESGASPDGNVFAVHPFASGDYIELQLWQNSGSAVNTVQISGTPLFRAHWIGTA